MQFYNMVTGQTIEATEWQMALKVGDFYANEAGIVAYLDADSEEAEVLDTPPAIYGEILEADEPGYFWVRAYSQWCPEGEFGSFNICEATRQLTKEGFEEARQNDWP